MTTINFGDYVKLINQCAFKGYTRLRQAGVNVDYEDVFQHMCETFCLANNKFDQDSGYKFSTYLVSAIWRQFNRWCESELNHTVHSTSIHDLSITQEMEDGQGDLYEVLPSNELGPEKATQLKLDGLKAYRALSIDAKRIVRNLIIPNARTRNAWNIHQQQIEHGKTLGIMSKGAPREMKMTFIMDLHGMNAKRRASVKREIGMAFDVNWNER